MKRQLIALVLVTVMAIAILGAVGVTTAPTADAKYATKLRLYGPASVTSETHVRTYRVSGTLTYAHYVPSSAGLRPVTSPVPYRLVYLYYKDCPTTDAAGQGAGCWGVHYWTTVRTDRYGHFVSPVRTASMPVDPQVPSSVTLTRVAYTYARFVGDSSFGPCSSNVVKTTFSSA